MQFGPRKHCEDVKASTTVMYHYDGAGKLFLVPDAAAADAAAADAAAVDGPAAASEEERPEVARDACAGFSTGRLQVLSFDARRYAGSAEVTYTHRDVSPSESSPRRGSSGHGHVCGHRERPAGAPGRGRALQGDAADA